jgi:hypothetical protein
VWACCRVFSLEPVEGYVAPTLAGHKQTLVASFFAGKERLQWNPSEALPKLLVGCISCHAQTSSRLCLCLASRAGAKVAEDARLSSREIPGLYTVSSDGALFSWVYEHGKEDHDRRKKRRVEPSAALPNGKDSAEKDGDEDAEAGLGPGSEADGRAAPFSGMAP